MQATKIYIIEDSFMTALHLSKLLEREGYNITGISDNGEEALEEIKALKPDMVLVDILLAGKMNGIETATLLKKQFNIPHIFITVLTDKDTIQKAKITEPYGYLIKPYTDLEVLTIIETGIYKSVQENKIKHHVQQAVQEKELAVVHKQLTDLRLHSLYSALNPHFIFNALNAIQFFILQQDRLNAVSYLSAFSKLIRGILNYSAKGTIPLKEELELLQYYVQLEQLRFGNKFDFTVHVDVHMNPKHIYIPPLLIHTFIGNSILYSLGLKRSKGHLQLTISEGQEKLCLKIEDDGIGQSAGNILKQKLPEISSNSLLETERLQSIIYDNKIDIEVTERDYTNKENPGTRVIITIPIQNNKEF